LAQPSRVRGRKLTSVGVAKGRALRRRETDEEARMWVMLRNRRFRGFKFLRQYAIEPFVVDFVCRELMLAVELDGSQHAESDYDERRTAYLNARGYSVLRFWNDEVRDLDGVWRMLSAIVDDQYTDPSPGWRYSPATLSPEGRGEAVETPRLATILNHE
jgi:very-short-patch-repair endonuclease